MTILLTGATGFVGSHILDALFEIDAKVNVISRPTSKAALTNWPNIQQVILTDNLFLEDEEWLCNALNGVDVVIHASWYAEPGRYLNSDLNLECLTGTIALAKAAKLVGVKKFVGIGTCFEYAESNEPLSVDSALGPTTTYAAAKTACYYVLKDFFKDTNTDFAWARLFYLHGEREDSRRLTSYLIDRLSKGEPAELTSGEQIRDYMNVADAAKAILDVSIGAKVGPINICSGNATSIRDFAESVAVQYDALSCLKFGKRAPNLTDPPFVVGIPNYK